MTEDKQKIFNAFIIPGTFVLLMWIVKLVEVIFNLNFTTFGILPRSFANLPGIIFSPLIHAGFTHLFSNTIPMIFLGWGVVFFYKNASIKVFLSIYFFTGILVWLFAREAYHIGASGIIYGLVTFLFFSGIIRRDNRSIALALVVTFLYGSLIWGVLPVNNGISWESHLFGALIGIVLAFLLRKSDPYKRYDWEDEDYEEDKRNLEISYDNKNSFE
jgi:membrane associated rhomboid family serine protease